MHKKTNNFAKLAVEFFFFSITQSGHQPLLYNCGGAQILDKKGQVDTFILDFEKAFNTSPHKLLKSKLFSYGIGGMHWNHG